MLSELSSVFLIFVKVYVDIRFVNKKFLLKFWIIKENVYVYKRVTRHSISKINKPEKLKKIFIKNAKFRNSFYTKDILEFEDIFPQYRKCFEVEEKFRWYF